MRFETVFDAGRHGYSTWQVPAFGLIFVFLGAMLVFRPRLTDRLLPRGVQGRARRRFGYVYLAFAVIWTLAVFIITFSQYLRAREALTTGRYNVVEGRVTQFVPMPYTGHADEHFCVSGACFCYSDYLTTVGFHNTASHGGPIREGLYVRILYIGNLILKLEILEPAG